MLDLNKLEQKLDKALENETTESLTDWIMKRKAKALSNFVGEICNYTQMKIVFSEFSVKVFENKERYNSNMHNHISLTEDLLNAS